MAGDNRLRSRAVMAKIYLFAKPVLRLIYRSSSLEAPNRKPAEAGLCRGLAENWAMQHEGPESHSQDSSRVHSQPLDSP